MKRKPRLTATASTRLAKEEDYKPLPKKMRVGGYVGKRDKEGWQTVNFSCPGWFYPDEKASVPKPFCLLP